MTILIATITHTGRRSLQVWRGLPLERSHITPERLALAKSGDYYVVTTYRDPVDTLESWSRRNPVFNKTLWNLQWRLYLELLPVADQVIPIERLPVHIGAGEAKFIDNQPAGSDRADAIALRAEIARVMRW